MSTTERYLKNSQNACILNNTVLKNSYVDEKKKKTQGDFEKFQTK